MILNVDMIIIYKYIYSSWVRKIKLKLILKLSLYKLIFSVDLVRVKILTQRAHMRRET